MVIAESTPELKIIREVNFKMGLNIIVDESSSRNEKGNNVGKTTFLKLIDICLGAKDKKYIWTDNDTGSETTKLKNYISDKKVFAELKVTTSAKKQITLRVELFDRGKRYIDGQVYPLTSYHEKLNEIFFDISSPPTFRQLIGKFVRINQKEDSNTFLKYLHTNTTDVTYQNIYEFLFKLSSHESSAIKLELQNDIKSLKNDLERIIKLHNFANINDLSERNRIVMNSVKQLQKKVNTLINIKDFEKNIEKSIFIKDELNIINDTINNINFRKSKIEQILNAEAEQENLIEEKLLLEFYNEINVEIENISKNFEELVSFNNQIKQNKLSYYSKRLESLNAELKSIIEKRDSFINENKNIIRLINEENYTEFEKLHKELLNQSELLGELNKVKSIYESLTSDLKLKEERLDEFQDSEVDSDNLSKFNEYLIQYSYLIFGQRLYLSPHSPFPVKLSNVDDGIGTGHRKTITLLLDIAYVSFINELNLDYPRFFVHDVIETVDKYNFQNIVNFINENNSQFIFAILNEKISDYPFINETDKRLKLSIEDKLFMI
ncbi:hypothetical protein [Planococcus maritimus]|uniref:hypothetical protein n=1 Tax=Planococcus maritimus TaxID=192421 RepID=UPI001641DE83|nr:hypothetical protein [Planococcus maritimus]